MSNDPSCSKCGKQGVPLIVDQASSKLLCLPCEQGPTANYRLSKNDLDIINHYTKGKAISDLAEKTLTILSKVFGGLHHLPYGKLEKFPWTEDYCITYVHPGSLSTYDPGDLSGMVILAHDMAVRLTIGGKANHYLEFLFHQRERSGDFSRRHPTIEAHTAGWRRNPTYEYN